MMRRMKIKAAPNVMGLNKKSNVPKPSSPNCFETTVQKTCESPDVDLGPSISDDKKLQNFSLTEKLSENSQVVNSKEESMFNDCSNDKIEIKTKKNIKNVTDSSNNSPTLPNKNKVLKTKAKDELKENIEKFKSSENDSLFKKPKLNTIKYEAQTENKRLFNERKENYRKKIKGGKLENTDMTMFDLIFWNPIDNPMPGREEDQTDNQDNSVSASDTRSVTSEVNEEQRIEEEGLQPADTGESALGNVDGNLDRKLDMLKPSVDEDENAKDNTGNGDIEDSAAPAPQVKIGPNGELVIDEKSLIIQTTAAKNRDEILSKAEVVEELNDSSSYYGRWSKRRKRSTEWTCKETARFYKALSTVGTDFSLMETIFTWRSRAELKIKFKKEERINRNLIDTALNDCTQFDFSIFEEEDYDPTEDRRQTKEACREDAKRRRQEERDERKRARLDEKKHKEQLIKSDKERKKTLRGLYCDQKARDNRRKARKLKALVKAESQAEFKLNTQVESEANSPLSIDAKEVICEVVFAAQPAEAWVENNCTISEDGAQNNPDSGDPLQTSDHTSQHTTIDHENKMSSTSTFHVMDKDSAGKTYFSAVPNDSLSPSSSIRSKNETNESHLVDIILTPENSDLISPEDCNSACDIQNPLATEKNTDSNNDKDDTSTGQQTQVGSRCLQLYYPPSAICHPANGDAPYVEVSVGDSGRPRRLAVPPSTGVGGVFVMTTPMNEQSDEYMFHVYAVAPSASSTVPASAADIYTTSTSAADICTVPASAADICTVPASAADISTVPASAADISTVPASAADIYTTSTSAADIYTTSTSADLSTSAPADIPTTSASSPSGCSEGQPPEARTRADGVELSNDIDGIS